MKKILLILIYCISFIYANDLEKVSLQLKWKYQFQFAGFITAKEKGFYKDVGIDVELREFREDVKIVEEIIDNKIDFAISDSALVYDALQDKPIKALMAVFQESPFVLMGLNNGSIKSIEDLNNKRISLYEGIDGISIKAMLKTKNINYIASDSVYYIDKLTSGEIDMMTSYTSNELFVAKEQNLDIITFSPKDYGFEGYGDILFTSEEMIEKRPQLVKRFYEASLKGWEYSYRHTDEIVDLIYKKYNTLNKTKRALYYEASVLENISGYGNNLGELNIEKIKSIAQQFNLVKNEHNKLDILDEFISKLTQTSNNISADSNILNVKNELSLSKVEQAYLSKHKTITVHNEKNWAPYNYNENGKAKGFSIDYMELLAQKLNINIEYIQNHNWDEFLKLIKNEKIDVISNITETEMRKKYIHFTTPYIISKKAIFSNLPNIKKISDLNGKVIAMPKNFYIQEYVAQHYPKIKIKTYKDTKDALYSVVNKEADAIIENLAVVTSLMKTNGLSLPYVTIKDDKELISSLQIGVRKSQKILRDILEKAKKTVTDEEFLRLERKWFGVEKNTENLFNKKELDYIKKREFINVCYHKEQHPWIIKNEEKMEGYSFEFLKHITNKSNLKFKMIESSSVSDHFNKIKNGSCDVSPVIVTKPNKFEFLTSTVPIIEDNIVLVTKINEPYIANVSDLKDKKIGIHNGKQSLIKYIQSHYPKLNVIEVDNLDLDKIVNGEFYGFIDASYKMSYNIYPQYINSLKIMSKIGTEKLKGSFGITVREPILLSIFNKSIANITRLEKQQIRNAWVYIEIEKQFDYILFMKFISVFIFTFIILSIFYFKQKKLKDKIQLLNNNLEQRVKDEVLKNREKDKLMLSQSRLAQMGEIISMIAHQWRQPLNSLSLLNQTVLLKYERGKLNDQTIEFFRVHSKKQIHEMSKTIDDFRDFFKPEKVKTKFLLNKMIVDTIALVKPVFISHNIDVYFDKQEEYKVLGYENELGQAILNILNNAKDVLIEKKIEKKKIVVTIEKSMNDITISILDNAGGINTEIIDHIFDPYFSTKDGKNGTGLGLYMSKMIIEEHMKGTISVMNRNEGALFKITLQKLQEEIKNV